ncbi:hypothetical protein ABMD20_06100 [Weissella confusa]|uniref:hypothetical protein n=1 Tax=Weissella confusa TaxID=1583 RepID=UPI00396F5D1D
MILNWVLPIVYVGYTVWRQWQPRLVTTTYKVDVFALAVGLIIAGTAVQNDWVNPNAAGWLIVGLIAVVSVGLLSIARTLSEEMWVTDDGEVAHHATVGTVVFWVASILLNVESDQLVAHSGAFSLLYLALAAIVQTKLTGWRASTKK